MLKAAGPLGVTILRLKSMVTLMLAMRPMLLARQRLSVGPVGAVLILLVIVNL